MRDKLYSNDKVTTNYSYYLLDKNFKNKSNLINCVDQSFNFFNGKQYQNPNPKNYIRVVINICNQAVTTIASKIVGTPTYIRFTSDNENVDCTKLEHFDAYNLNKLNEDTLDYQVTEDGLVYGTSVTYLRWDETDMSYKGIYKGGLQQETIDLLNFAVANPNLDSSQLQNQKWVMFWKDEEVGALRELVEGENEEDIKKKRELILPDDYSDKEGEYTKNPESIAHGLCRLYTRYFRVNGEVCFTCETKNVSLFLYPHALSPYVNKKVLQELQKEKDAEEENPDKNANEMSYQKIIDYKTDFENVVMNINPNKKMSEEEYAKEKEKFSLYPFATFAPSPINRSFYGKSYIQELIPSQKAINQLYSVYLQCAINAAYNKVIAKDGALRGQEITTELNQIITDYSRGNNFGISFAQSQPIPNSLIEQGQLFAAMLKDVYGYNSVMGGDITNQNISGYAVQLMIKQANTAIEQQQKIFWKYLSNKAAIRLQFYKFYVDKAKYTRERDNYEINRLEQSRIKLLSAQNLARKNNAELEIEKRLGRPIDLTQKTSRYAKETISKEELFGNHFDIAIDCIQGTADSKLAESQAIDNLIMNGTMSQLTPEQLELYVNISPIISANVRNKVKDYVETLKASENYQLREMVNKLASQNQELQNLLQASQSQVQYQKDYNAQFEKNFTNKYKALSKLADMQKNTLANMMASNQNKISEGEAKSNNSRGIKGSDIATPTQAILGNSES